MLKVIIADDEPHICQLLETLIDWTAEGFTLVGFANNGYEVAQLCISNKPDLLITDIRMPGLDGLELIQQLHGQMPSIQVIIITGYSQFQYAHQALRYGVVDYLLKPINTEELLIALRNVKEKICHSAAPALINREEQPVSTKSMQTIKGNILLSILTSSEQNVSFSPEEYHIEFAGDFWRLLQIEAILDDSYDNLPTEDYLGKKVKEILSEEFKKNHYELVFTKTAKGYFCLINGTKACFDTFLDHMQTVKLILTQVLELFKGTFTVGVSNVCRDFQAIGNSARECGQAIDHKIIAGKNQVIYFSDIPSNEHQWEEFITDEFEREFKKGIADANQALMSGCVSDLMSALNLMSQQISGTLVQEVYSRTIRLFFASIRVFGTENFGNYSEGQLISQGKYFYNITSAFMYLSNLFRTIVSALVEKRGEQSTKPIRMAQFYIDEHYTEPVKLQEVAEYVGLTPTYLSTLFKKQVGKSLVEYLTHVRIQNAKQLLIDRNRNISDIADEVGFVDEKYFIKRFKKMTGLTPNEYRKLFGNG